MIEHPKLTVDRLLAGLRRRGLMYRPDLRQEDGLWTAQCPRCASYGDLGMQLTIHETRRAGPATIRCRRGCPPESIALNLAVAAEPTSIEARLRRLELLVLGRETASVSHGQ